VNILITSTIAAVQPEAPSHLEPGLSNDIVCFKVAAAPYPSAAVLSHLLSEVCSDWHLSAYEPSTGTGTFISIDFEGPETGSVVYISSAKPIPETRFVVCRPEPEPA
jgi:hypothetical protein